MTTVYGCTIQPVAVAACKALIAWVNGTGSAIAEAANTDWLLAHCNDGVVWGRWDVQQNRWRLSTVQFPKYGRVSPLLAEENLQQLRVFGSEREVLVWRTEGGFTGRVLIEGSGTVRQELQPKEEKHILVGDRLLAGPVDGFSLVGDARGSRHAVPLLCEEKDFKDGNRTRWPLRLTVRHYFTQNEDTGVVQIAASRLVKVMKE